MTEARGLPPPRRPERRMSDARQRRLAVPLQVPDIEPVEAEPPFLRPAHRTRVRRPRRSAAFRVLLGMQLAGAALVAVAAAWAGYSKVMASERLRVLKVEVRGNHFLSEGEVRELLGPAVGGNILAVDIHALKAALRASPWVADATVARTLPDTLRVDVQERVPLALAEVERLYLMAADGTLIDIYGPRTAAFDLPIVRGLRDAEAGERAARAARAGALLDDLGDLSSEISEVEVEPEGDLRVVLRGAGEILKLGPPPYRSRLVTFLSLREELRRRCPRAEYFDLRYRDRIYAKEKEIPLPAPVAPAPGPAPEKEEPPHA